MLQSWIESIEELGVSFASDWDKKIFCATGIVGYDQKCIIHFLASAPPKPAALVVTQ